MIKLNQESTNSAGDTSTITKLDLKTVQDILAGTDLTFNKIWRAGFIKLMFKEES